MCHCLLCTPSLGSWPATQACALTGNQTGSLLVYSLVLNPLSHTSQGYFLYIFIVAILTGVRWYLIVSLICILLDIYEKSFQIFILIFEKETSICCSTYLCIHWLILACALTRDRTCNLGIWEQRGNQLSYLATVSYTHLTLPTNWWECRSRWSPYH